MGYISLILLQLLQVCQAPDPVMHPSIDLTSATKRSNTGASVIPKMKQVTLVCSVRMTHAHSS